MNVTKITFSAVGILFRLLLGNVPNENTVVIARRGQKISIIREGAAQYLG